MKTSVKQAQSIVGTSPGRPKNDFYPTPIHVTRSLLSREEFPDPILEPACGNGAMSKVLVSRYYEVTSSDLCDYGYGYSGIDFLGDYYEHWSGSIITNPPFTLAIEFMQHSLDLGCKKLALFCKLAFLEGQKRSVLLEASPLKNIYVFRKRVLLTRNGEKPRGSGMIAFAWYVWEQGYDGKPMVNWI